MWKPPKDSVQITADGGNNEKMAEESGVTVYVTGAVKHPGVYDLMPGARVSDALKAAGDVLPYADLEEMNLAAPAADGIRIMVPICPETGQYSSGNSGKIPINTATESELNSVPGVGISTAKKIIEYREAHGFFHAKEDLMNIPGIGEGEIPKKWKTGSHYEGSPLLAVYCAGICGRYRIRVFVCRAVQSIGRHRPLPLPQLFCVI